MEEIGSMMIKISHKIAHLRIQIEASGNVTIAVNNDIKLMNSTKGLMIQSISLQNHLILREIPFV